ncbi:MAG: hypothetical protein ACI9TK_001225 [Flavobacteriaceae bacterium]|jgi:uncharacterized protein YqgV (UPF0045/DUF77 family)|tara:strand:- start:580 stop:840 length:261 start_codon:yes stop_codon:yes gene_type:complete
MNLSVELTLMPLKKDFIPSIKGFIKALRNSGFTVLENPLSTQIYGDYDALMAFLTPKIKTTFEAEEAVILQLKFVKGDRSQYAPDF